MKDKEESLGDLYLKTKLPKEVMDDILKTGEETIERDFKEKYKTVEEKEEREIIKEEFKRIYQDIIHILKQYCDLRKDYYPIISLWIIGTYFHKNFLTYPYLYFNAMKGSGKSRTLSLIAYLSYNGKVVISVSESVLFRTARDSTICIDEFERTRSKEKANLRELLNAAYKKGISVERMKKVKDSKTSTENYEVEKFDVFCPIAMANISGMDSVLGDRALHLGIEKSTLASISRKLEIWHLDALIKQIKEKLVSPVPMSPKKKYIDNLYIIWNNRVTCDIHNTSDTSDTSDTTTNILINKILKTSLDGRHLELFFPLFVIADYCNDLDNIINIAEKMIEEKKEMDIYENRDVSLIDFISRKDDDNLWFSQKDMLREFKEFLGEEEDKWLNNTWFGIALNRLNLLKDKRRHSKGRDIILNVKKAQEKIKMFK